MEKYQVIKEKRKFVEFKDVDVKVLSDNIAIKLIENYSNTHEHLRHGDDGDRKAMIAVMNSKRLTKNMMERLYGLSFDLCCIGDRWGHPGHESIKWWNQDGVKHQLKINLLRWLENMSRYELDLIIQVSNSTVDEYVEARLKQPHYERAISKRPPHEREKVKSNLRKSFAREYDLISKTYIDRAEKYHAVENI